jgi:quercetin dioxygenase-like cupin family protein
MAFVQASGPETLIIERNGHGAQTERVGALYARAAEYFTARVRVDPLFKAPPPARTSGACVTFELCSRSHWHTHRLGQTLIVTAGCGLV